MRTFKIKAAFFMAFLIVGLCATSCSDDSAFEGSIDIEDFDISVNRKGLTSRGQTTQVLVTSNVYWVVDIPGDVDWLTVSPMAGFGTTYLTLNVDQNYGDRRETVIKLETASGMTKEIKVSQNASSEELVYLQEDCGTTPIEDDSFLDIFTDWTRDGIGSYNVRYRGESAYISSETPSSLTGASAGNNVYLPEGGTKFYIRGISTVDDFTFLLQFSVYNPSGSDKPVTVKASDAGTLWGEVEYSLADTGTGWTQASAQFRVAPGTESVYFLFKSEEDEVRIDDIGLYEGTEDSPLVEFTGSEDGGSSVTPITIFEDDFSWLPSSGGYPAVETGGANGSDGTRMDSWSATDYSANPGYTFETGKFYIYTRSDANGSALKFCRASTNAEFEGRLVTPVFTKVEGTMDLDVTLEVATYKASGENTRIRVDVTGGGTMTQNVFSSGSTDWSEMAWTTVSFRVANATNSTQLVIGPEFANGNSTNNRFFLNSIKVVSTVETIGGTPEGLPVSWLFSAAAMPAYQATFQNENYVMANDIPGLGAKMEYVPVETPALSQSNVIVGATGHPYITGPFKDDYWLFTVPVKNIPQGSIMNISFITRSSAAGLRYWRMEYFTGTEWEILGTPLQTSENPANSYTIEMNWTGIGLTADDNITVNENFTIARDIIDGEIMVRMICASNVRTENGVITAVRPGGNVRIAGAAGTSPTLKLVSVP